MWPTTGAINWNVGVGFYLYLTDSYSGTFKHNLYLDFYHTLKFLLRLKDLVMFIARQAMLIKLMTMYSEFNIYFVFCLQFSFFLSTWTNVSQNKKPTFKFFAPIMGHTLYKTSIVVTMQLINILIRYLRQAENSSYS